MLLHTEPDCRAILLYLFPKKRVFSRYLGKFCSVAQSQRNIKICLYCDCNLFTTLCTIKTNTINILLNMCLTEAQTLHSSYQKLPKTLTYKSYLLGIQVTAST